MVNGSCIMFFPKTFLVFGQDRPPMIKGIGETSGLKNIKYITEVIAPILNVTRPNALDFDVKNEYIYFSDV